MKLVREVLGELVGMFVADLRLTIAILTLIAIVAALAGPLQAGAAVSGSLLLLGSLAVLVAAVLSATRRGPRTPPRP